MRKSEGICRASAETTSPPLVCQGHPKHIAGCFVAFRVSFPMILTEPVSENELVASGFYRSRTTFHLILAFQFLAPVSMPCSVLGSRNVALKWEERSQQEDAEVRIYEDICVVSMRIAWMRPAVIARSTHLLPSSEVPHSPKEKQP